MARAQRRRLQRCELTDPDEALMLNALVNRTLDNAAWDSHIRFYSEGLGPGDLFIEGDGLSGNPIRELVLSGYRVPGRYILIARDEGDLPGYAREIKNGFTLYRRLSA